VLHVGLDDVVVRRNAQKLQHRCQGGVAESAAWRRLVRSWL